MNTVELLKEIRECIDKDPEVTLEEAIKFILNKYKNALVFRICGAVSEVEPSFSPLSTSDQLFSWDFHSDAETVHDALTRAIGTAELQGKLTDDCNS